MAGLNDLSHNGESMEKNQQESNLISFSDEQLEPLEDKADNELEQASNVFSVTTDIEDDDPFTFTESKPMEIPKNFRPRERRVSDVIDSLGDVIQEINDVCKSGSMPVPPSPLSSGYGSFGAGIANLPSPVMKTRPDVTDGSKNSVIDATPMKTSDDSSSGEYAVEGVMSVHMESEEYNMSHKRRGKAVILNHDKFESSAYPSREGSHLDVNSLEKTYSELGFEVVTHHNLEYLQIKKVLNDLAEEDHSDADCLVVTVLTHGVSGNYLLSKDVPYQVERLWTPFLANTCTTLAGKPKIFIIQACRGEKLDPGISLKDRRGSRTETDSGSSYKIPVCADFLIAFSSVEGYYSWRNPDFGTWYIQSLCQELNENWATMDLVKMMTRISRRVALHYRSYNDMIPWQDDQKQVPSFISMLIRDVYFK